MTITTTALGAHTTQISLSGETSPANFITALDTAIVSGGWAQYDVSNQYNRIYSCLNADGSTYKLIGIFIDPGTFKINTTTYELWNTTTHVGTNEAFTYGRSGTMGFALTGTDVIVMVSSKWLILQTAINNQLSPWSGVFEVAREMPEDTASAGYPCWAWTSSTTIFSTAGDTSRPFVSFPRTVKGLTGSAATATVSLQLPTAVLGASGGGSYALSAIVTSGWNASNTVIQPARPIINGNEMHGQIYGAKFTGSVGSAYNQINVPVDSSFNYSTTGTSIPHWVLTGHPSTVVTSPLSTTSTGTGYITPYSVSLSGTPFGAVPVGTNWYAATSNGTYSIASSGTTLGTPALITGASGICHDIVYDGYQYLYVATAAGVSRIDTLNSNAVTSVAITGGTSSLFYDGTYVWAGSRGQVSPIKISQIPVSSFTVSTTISLANATTAYVGGICSDYAGNTYVVTTESRLYKIVNSTGVATGVTNLGSAGYAVALSYNGTYLVAGFPAATLFHSYITTSGTFLTNYNTNATLTNTGVLAWGKMPSAKIGIYDVFAATYTAASGMQGVSVNLNSTGSSGIMYGSAIGYCTVVGCDGNKAWSTNYNTNVLTVFTNLYHQDENATTYGRVLLPT
jgi:hypothetical protein